MKVCINPAHLMTTPGKMTPPYPNGSVIHECEQNFPVAFELVRQLEHNGIECVLTEDDMYMPLPDNSANVDMYTRIAFEQNSGADIYVSIHKNAGPEYAWTSYRGTETYCYKFGANGEKLARLVHARVVSYTGDKDRGVKSSNYAELRDTIAPAIICELGFMTNEEDAKDMLNYNAQYLYAVSIAHGICDYFSVEFDKLPKEDDADAIKLKYDMLIQVDKIQGEINDAQEELNILRQMVESMPE